MLQMMLSKQNSDHLKAFWVGFAVNFSFFDSFVYDIEFRNAYL